MFFPHVFPLRLTELHTAADHESCLELFARVAAGMETAKREQSAGCD